jgi:hypothetical protein
MGDHDMRKSILAAAAAALFLTGATAHAQNKGGVNVGSLECKVAGGMGFIFGSSKALDCVFARTDGTAERYAGTIKKFGVDIGFTKEAHIIWLVFAPGTLAKDALAGDYAGGGGSAAVGVGVGANAMIGGGAKNVTLQPVSVEGSVGLNVAAGVVAVELKAAK